MGKNLLYAVVALGVIGGVIFFVKDKNRAPQEAEIPTASTESPREMVRDGKYMLAAESTLNWEGRKNLIVGYKDVGTLKAKEGNFTVSGGKVADGKIIFNMSTIQAGKTGKGMGEEGLERHLKSDDFFATEKFPTAEFMIRETVSAEDVQSSHRYAIKGDLIMKGITQSVEIPAIVYLRDGSLRVEGAAEFDRTKWDIRYGSDKFFDNLANNVIDDMFSISFQFTASAQ